jgi:hypothetical protein
MESPLLRPVVSVVCMMTFEGTKVSLLNDLLVEVDSIS